MEFRHYCSDIILLIILLLFATTGHTAVTPKKNARILYGTHSEQIGVIWAGGQGEGDNPYDLGPKGFAVDGRGDIYLGDYVNGAVKRFSSKGQLLAVTEGIINNIQSFWVSPTGNLYVRSEDRPSELIRFDVCGHRVWTRTFREIVPRDVLTRLEQEHGVKFPSGFSTEITAGPKGTIMLQAKGTLPSGRIGARLSIIMNEKGEFVESRPYFGMESGGIWWQYQVDFTKLADGVAPPITVNTYTEDGTRKQTISLDVQVDGTRYQHLKTYSSIWAFPDQSNGTLLVTMADRKDSIKVTPTVLVSLDYIIDRYDDKGKFVERFQFADGPFTGTFQNVAVSPDGLLYFLRYDSKGLDVMVL